MMSYRTKVIVGLIGMAIFATFVIGLALSISTGFAGLMGGLPFSIIVGVVLLMALYDYWDECIRRK